MNDKTEPNSQSQPECSRVLAGSGSSGDLGRDAGPSARGAWSRLPSEFQLWRFSGLGVGQWLSEMGWGVCFWEPPETWLSLLPFHHGLSQLLSETGRGACPLLPLDFRLSRLLDQGGGHRVPEMDLGACSSRLL